MKTYLLIALIVASATGLPRPRKNQGRIYGGQDAALGQFPYAVAINDPDQWCDGVIISESWILTAAQCASYLLDPEILAGTNSEAKGGTIYHIAQVIIHEEFDDFYYTNDIALIQIDGTFIFDDNTAAIEIGEVGDNVTCTALGWGVTETETYPDILKYVEMNTLNIDSCIEIAAPYIEEWYSLGETNVCTTGEDGKGVCEGDIGGPLVCDGKVAGIISYIVDDSCGTTFPNVYTRTANYADWIQTNIAAVKK